ncbi:MAG: branched-chain amino acid ABC transporter permease, partial [Hydrogenophaga sp.]|nr:branched-chain amino acid ABC transporter permease [Hydrogenophaga sp.]HAJ13715.1 branched-chain amino acid ABC transporter permease [Comamonadaceae bacterium]
SIQGAFLAALLIGMLQTLLIAVDLRLGQAIGMLARYAPAVLADVKVSQLAPIAPYALMVAMLLLRPRGLFGRRDA